MTVIELLEKRTDKILKEALESISRSHLEHYEKTDKKHLEERFRNLLQFTIRCLKEKKLMHINEYAEKLGQERFSSGYDLREVQIAINILEEVVWKEIVKEIRPENLAQALGLVSTVLGSAKDTLAQTYVSLASKTRSASLDLKKMFS